MIRRSTPNLIPAGVSTATATAAKTGSSLPVTVHGFARTVQCARDLAPAAGDVVLIVQQGAQWVAVARLFTAAPAAVVGNAAVPDPDPAVIAGTTVFAPSDMGTHRAAGWRADASVRQGQQGTAGLNTGAVFYGGAPAALSGATVTAATLAVRRQGGAGTGSTLWQVTETDRPSGAPTLGASTAGPALSEIGQEEEFALPASWGQAIVDGTAGGLAFYDADGSPYVAFDGRDTWPPAFTLTLEWTR